MWRALKIFLITVAGLFSVLLIAASIVLCVVFTPNRLTPLVRSQANKMLTCQSNIGEVELTFFRTFPQFGLKISDFALINTTPGAQNDTLVAATQIMLAVDVKQWLNSKQIKVNEIKLENGLVNVFVDSLGITNYNIYNASDSDTLRENKNTEIPIITIDGISIQNTNINYTNHAEMLYADIQNLNAGVCVSMAKNRVRSNVQIHSSLVSFAYANDIYLQNTPVHFHMISDFIYDKQQFLIDNFAGVINNTDLQLSGSIAYNPKSGDISTGLSYTINASPLASVIELVPPSFQSYIEKIEANGIFSSSGSIVGTLSQTEMPFVDMNITLENGKLSYADFPLILHDVSGDIVFKSDLLTNDLTSLQINHFEAKTPQSQISTVGTVSQLFSDIHLDLQTEVNLTLEEFIPFVPDNVHVDVKGKARGQIASAFSLSQIEKFELEKMKLTGKLTFTCIDAVYDSILLMTDQTTIGFSLPNRNSQSPNTGFALARVTSNKLKSTMPGKFDAVLQNASINVQMSDMRDTTRIPDVLCSFDIDSLYATMDTLGIALSKPVGSVLLVSDTQNPDILDIALDLNSNKLKGRMGQNLANTEKMNLNTNIVYNSKQKNVFQQWQPEGFFDLEQVNIALAGFTYPVQIPSIKFDFTPEIFTIEESSIILDKSDFQLSGTLNNVFSYFKNDSILRGTFDFVSNTTDITQLMSLTSGIGYADNEVKNTPKDTSYSGPYMVPKGLDITLNTHIKHASFRSDSASNIKGTVRVYDGNMLLDRVRLVTPAARMQLTAMYSTPRKNHLFMGLDYHMLDVEISELLSMIPEVDSLMPMLRSFGGEGEFHLAVETYLDSTYTLKMSTLRGAASIAGQDLVLMDGETFSEIAKTLRFTKQAENRVDSLSAEFTVFREEIDVYPFLIVMDRYKAIVAGRHNLDMSFDYHISLVDSPLPVKLGVDVRGTLDNLLYKPVRPRYAETYRPAARFAVANKQLELRELIRESLTKKIDW